MCLEVGCSGRPFCLGGGHGIMRFSPYMTQTGLVKSACDHFNQRCLILRNEWINEAIGCPSFLPILMTSCLYSYMKPFRRFFSFPLLPAVALGYFFTESIVNESIVESMSLCRCVWCTVHFEGPFLQMSAPGVLNSFLCTKAFCGRGFDGSAVRCF